MNSIWRLAGLAATALASCAAGWLISTSAPTPERAPDRPKAPLVVRPGAPSLQAADSGPLIAVSSDGNVTLRVEQEPLAWVLEQIAKQSGWADVKERAQATATSLAERPAAPPDPAACPEASLIKPEQADRLLQAIQHGSEAERFQGLLQAREVGVVASDQMLKVMYETDASERVRLLAFETYLEPRGGDSAALRRALEAALYVPDGAIQGEAKKRLDELAESERIDAASEQKTGPE